MILRYQYHQRTRSKSSYLNIVTFLSSKARKKSYYIHPENDYEKDSVVEKKGETRLHDRGVGFFFFFFSFLYLREAERERDVDRRSVGSFVKGDLTGGEKMR